MANLRKDEKSVYIDLWGETLEYDRIQYALYQLNSAFELRISEDTDTILNYRLNGVPYKVSTVNGQQTNDICPYSWESLEYVGKTIEEAGRCANEILAEYGIELNPNWKEINKQWLTEVDRLEKLFGDALGKATQAALNNQAYKYQQAYNEELSKDFGLSFGVLSSSLTAHLLYAAQSAAKERKDHARAERVASEVMQNSHADITAQIFASVYPIYVDSLEPTMQKLLSQYYAYIISIFSKELGCSYDDVIATFNFERSNDFILSKTESVKNNILQALQVDPNNGNVIGYAIRNGILDEELCEHGKNATPNFDITLKKWAISALSEIHTAGKLFNKPLITDENKGIITGLKTYYKYQCANLEKCRDWQNIVLSVFTEEASKHLVEWGEISTAIASMLIPEEFDKLAKSGKRFYIDNKSKALFVDLYHELCFDGAYTSAAFLELTPPFSADDIDKKLNEYNKKLKLRSAELSRQAEQERKEEEVRKEAQRQAEIKQQEEKQKQREIMKRKVKKTAMVVISILIAISATVILFNSVIIPSNKYNSAIQHIENGEYTEAYIILKELGDYKDCINKQHEIEALYPQIPFKVSNVGDIVSFGAYEQDGTASNGKEKLQWRVLAVENDKVLVISVDCIESMSFQKAEENKTWETSSIRQWLNNDFYNTFTIEQKSYIKTSYLENETYILNSNSGNDTYDNIFLLSVDEARYYFDSDDARKSSFSEHASKDYDDPFWWLRTKGEGYLSATFVTQTGKINTKGLNYVFHDYGIRPAMWIDIGETNG